MTHAGGRRGGGGREGGQGAGAGAAEAPQAAQAAAGVWRDAGLGVGCVCVCVCVGGRKGLTGEGGGGGGGVGGGGGGGGCSVSRSRGTARWQAASCAVQQRSFKAVCKLRLADASGRRALPLTLLPVLALLSPLRCLSRTRRTRRRRRRRGGPPPRRSRERLPRQVCVGFAPVWTLRRGRSAATGRVQCVRPAAAAPYAAFRRIAPACATLARLSSGALFCLLPPALL